MSSVALALLTLACTVGGGVLGMLFSARLPEHQLDAVSRDAVKVGIGLLGTMASLVIGFLIASAKNSFDAKVDGIERIAADTIHLDRVLAQYGPETSAARELLRKAAAARVSQAGPGRGISPAKAGGADVIEALQRQLHELNPATGAQRALQSQALAISSELAQTRWLTLTHAGGSTIPTEFLVVLVSWVTILSAALGALAPRNATVVVALMVFALSVSAALFLIMELDTPYGGVIGISDAPLRFALEHLGR